MFVVGRRRARNRMDMISSVPAGHWKEAEILAEAGFPTRSRGKPYVVVVHGPSGSAFVLDGAYRLMTTQDTELDDLVRTSLLHHVDKWDGWLPTASEQLPWWAARLSKDEFTAYWIAE